MRKIFFFSLFLFLCFFSYTAAAIPDWKDTAEFYSTDISEKWTESISSNLYGGAGSFYTDLTQTAYPYSDTHCILVSAHEYLSSSGSGSTSITVTSNEYIYRNYVSFTLKKLSRLDGQGEGSHTASVRLVDSSGTTVATYDFPNYDSTTRTYEIVESGNTAYIYLDGVQLSVISNGVYDEEGVYKLQFYAFTKSPGWKYTFATQLYLDDISTESCIGTYYSDNEFSNYVNCSYRIQGLAQHPNYNYAVRLTSLSGDNAGLVNETELSNSIYSGYCSYPLSSTLGENYGLYSVSLMRDDLELDRDYFIYSLSTDPIPYPEILFLAGADVNVDVRDDDNNGGEISAGESVYLYPAINEDGIYNISYEILETPASFTADISKIYNSSVINSTNFTFSGLAGNNYYVSLNGAGVGSTSGLDTWEYSLSSWESGSYTFSFEPDYTVPGVWGYIKNSETQNPIKSATLKVSNNSETFYLYTDSNGQYYKTIDMAPGPYTVIVSKSGYTTSNPYNITAINGTTTRQDIFLDPESGAGVYYQSHDVTFTVLEYWYSSAGLPGVSYAVYDDENESVKNGTTGSKGTFTVTEMDAGKNYTFILTYNNQTYTEYLEPGLTEYNLVLNKEGIVHQYYNSWLNLTYAETSNNATILYTSNKTVSAASLSVTASNGTIVQSGTLNSTSGTFLFNFTDGDYILQFNIEASDGSTAAQAWSISSPPEVTLFPNSYPTWLKNTLFVAIIIIFLLAFGKSKNDIACGSVAVLTSLGYYFEWLSCGFNFVVLIWIIALGAIFLHYKRTGAVG